MISNLVMEKLFQQLSIYHDEKKKILSDNEKRSNPKDKYMKTIQHLNYIGGNGRMPKYLATGIKEVDLCGEDRDIEK